MQAIVYPPLVYSKDGRLYGVATEMVVEIQKLIGDDSKLVEAPWLRAYDQTQRGPMQAMFAIVRISEREALFKWVGPIFGEDDYFFKRQGSPLEIDSLDDVREREANRSA